MKEYLLQGFEKEAQINIIIGMTNTRSENVIDAMKDYFVKGHRVEDCIKMNGITDSNFSRAVKKLNEVAGQMHKYFELEFKRASEYELFSEWNEFKQNQISDNK